jgi:hypothetical protein
MSGNTACYEQRGLIPRVLAALLSLLRTAPGVTSWSLSLSYLEVYNDVLYDLLDINSSPSELTLYEDASGQLQVGTTVCCLLLQQMSSSHRSVMTVAVAVAEQLQPGSYGLLLDSPAGLLRHSEVAVAAFTAAVHIRKISQHAQPKSTRSA